MSENGGDGNVSLDGTTQLVNGESEGSGMKQPRPARRTRNTGRFYDEHGSSFTPKHDAIDLFASMILSKIDEESYEHAAWEDADRVMQNHVLPKCLPWSKPRVPLLRNLPRDIEDMQGVWHAGEDAEGVGYRKHINSGSLGYGMYDMGGLSKDDVKGTRAETIIAAKPSIGNSDTPLSPARTRRMSSNEDAGATSSKEESEIPLEYSDDTLTAAARRSDDPGIIELTVKLPLPSLTSCLLKCQRHKILPRDPWLAHDKKSVNLAKSILQAERAELCSSMPLYWGKVDKVSFQEPPAFVDLKGEEISNDDSTCDSLYSRMKKREQRKRKIEELSNACTKKWKISVKVAHISSRSKLTLPESRPMCLIAELPSYVFNGQSLTIESAAIKDEEENLRSFLGSYDCRATALTSGMSFEAMDTVGSKTSSGRSKRVSVGRTRLVWTEASTKYSKPMFSSLLTGEKLDAAAYKRPKDVKVNVVLNGKLISDTVVDEEAYKPRNFMFSEKFTWSKNQVHKAVITASESPSAPNTKDAEKQYFPENAQCSLDAEEYFNSLVRNMKKKHIIKGKSTQEVNDDPLDLVSEASVGSGELVPSYARPKFNCLPLDDGYLRIHCDKPGTLKGSSELPKFLSSVLSKNSDDPVCTVCWTGSETYKVLECLKCGLLCHRDCCLDGGTYDTNRKQDVGWICAVCNGVPYKEYLPKKSSLVHYGDKSIGQSSFDSAAKSQASRKSRRKSRLPTRFKENDQGKNMISPASASTPPPSEIDERILVDTIIPKCTLCPHSGGAMSIANKESKRWTHEVCRIWCNKAVQDTTSVSKNCSPQKPSGLHASFQDSVCCLCGMGKLHNEGHEKEEAMINFSSAQGDPEESLGLIKCAAANCTITFHPMCALLSTKLSPESLKRSSGAKKSSSDTDDALLCQRYSLDLIEVNRQEEGDTIGHHVENKAYVVPVGFCGFHNSERAEDMYGLLSKDCEQTKMISSLMHIPYQFSSESLEP